MTDNEIIKALECCSSPKVNACDDCPFHKRCYENNEWLEKQAIDLINRQKAEIERLTVPKELIDDDFCGVVCEFAEELIEKAKAEVVKEFAERLKAHTRKMQSSDFSGEFWDKAVLVEDIDNLVKEMVGE